MLSPHERLDRTVRATDLDALSSRLSANNKSYFEPRDHFIDDLAESYKKYLQFCMGYTSISAARTLRAAFGENKIPLINKGTYLRTKLINLIIESFIQEFEKCQIISLGSGSDTRAYFYLKGHDIIFHELDFPESSKIKLLAIKNNNVLRDLINLREDEMTSVNSKDDMAKLGAHLHTDRYHLYGMDLRELGNFTADLKKYVDLNRPTLILNECTLCYLSPTETQKIIEFWKNLFKSSNTLLSLLSYEPMSLNDAFGENMKNNLEKRGIRLLSFNSLPTLSSRLKFAREDCKLNNIHITRMSLIENNPVSSWIEQEEIARINGLELIDEIEELKLLLDHYFIQYAQLSSKNGISFNGIKSWNWDISNNIP